MVKEPYTIKVFDAKETPDIELFNAKNYQITREGVNSVVSSHRVARYGNIDKLYTVEASHITPEGLLGHLVSDEALLKENVITFMTHSRYERSDGVSLEGEEIRYDTKKETLQSKKNFIFTQQQSRTNGASFVYDMKEGTLFADAIYSLIQMQTDKGNKRQ